MDTRGLFWIAVLAEVVDGRTLARSKTRTTYDDFQTG